MVVASLVMTGCETETAIETVKIGRLEWATKNLGVKQFRNGDNIPEAKSLSEWISYCELKKPAFCYYNFDFENDTLGLIYNIYAVQDNRNIEPDGYRIADGFRELDTKDENIVRQLSGGLNVNDGFTGLGEHTMYWTWSSENQRDPVVFYATKLSREEESVLPFLYGLHMGCYVRCIKQIEFELFQDSKELSNGLDKLMHAFESFLAENYPEYESEEERIANFLYDFGGRSELRQKFSFNSIDIEDLFHQMKKCGLAESIFCTSETQRQYSFNFGENTDISGFNELEQEIEEELTPIPITEEEVMELNETNLGISHLDSLQAIWQKHYEKDEVKYFNYHVQGRLFNEFHLAYQEGALHTSMADVIGAVLANGGGYDLKNNALFVEALRWCDLRDVLNKKAVCAFVFYDLIISQFLPSPPQIDIVEVEMPEPEEPAEPDFFTIVEDMPVYPGGDAALMRFFAENTQYPPIARENEITGVVYVSYIVNKKGVVEDVKVVRGANDPSLDTEALRVVSSLTGYSPGKQSGRPVKVQFTVPIRFYLR
jgi:TonB family protein